jgi:putative endonuclease
MKTTKQIGDIGERAAAKFLKKNGYKILGRNLHFGRNELDIVAANRELILFVEVKTRSVASLDDISYKSRASDAVNQEKRDRTEQAARAYLSQNYSSKQPRMDVIEVYLLKDNEKKILAVNHIENAF